MHNVGDTFKIHPMLKVAARFEEPMWADRDLILCLQVKEFWPDITLGGAFFSRGHLLLVLAENWPKHRGRLVDHNHMVNFYVGIRGTGRGTVRPSLLSREASSLRYEVSDEGLLYLSQGRARLSMLLLAARAVEVYAAVHGIDSLRSREESIRWLDTPLPRDGPSLMIVHAFSACPIGQRRDRCEADSFGKVFGYDNLYINDASMLPGSPGVNPQETLMTFAHRNAAHYCEERP